MDNFHLTTSPTLANAPVVIGGTRLSVFAPAAIHALVLRPNNPNALSAEISNTVGPLPEIGRSTETANGAILLRTSQERAYVVGDLPETGSTATFYVLDQSDFWATLTLQGPASHAMLERSWRLNLADTAFPVGAAASSNIGQITTILFRQAAKSYQLMVPCSFVRSFFHELETSLHWVSR